MTNEERQAPPRKKRPKRSPGPKGRITKRTGDERSKPDKAKVRAYDPTRPLPGKVIRHLRALGHHLDPVVQVGKDGVTDAVGRAAGQALHDHELIKVKLPQLEKHERQEMAQHLKRALSAQIVDEVGRVLVLYRRHPDKPKIKLP